jgi:excisionase family DNA binding protein
VTKIAYTIEEAAEQVSVSKNLIRAAVRTGALRAKWTGRKDTGEGTGKQLIGEDALRAWFESLADA